MMDLLKLKLIDVKHSVMKQLRIENLAKTNSVKIFERSDYDSETHESKLSGIWLKYAFGNVSLHRKLLHCIFHMS